ncbi:hypothetical protein NL676_010787 [Syzygium grande]|nr:hypothetical protein NL676_010787 [Syzygium grande]
MVRVHRNTSKGSVWSVPCWNLAGSRPSSFSSGLGQSRLVLWSPWRCDASWVGGRRSARARPRAKLPTHTGRARWVAAEHDLGHRGRGSKRLGRCSPVAWAVAVNQIGRTG